MIGHRTERPVLGAPFRRIHCAAMRRTRTIVAARRSCSPRSPSRRLHAPASGDARHADRHHTRRRRRRRRRRDDKLDHLIFIVQENRSFDHYFGTYPGADGIPTKPDGSFAVCVPDPWQGGQVRPAVRHAHRSTSTADRTTSRRGDQGRRRRQDGRVRRLARRAAERSAGSTGPSPTATDPRARRANPT